MPRTDDPPETRRRFGSLGGELDYVNQKMWYWFHLRRVRRNAARYYSRIKSLLQRMGDMDIAIVAQTTAALIAEYEGSWNDGFVARKREIALVARLYRSFTPDQSKALQDHALRGRQPNEMARYLNTLRETYELAGRHEIAEQFWLLESEIQEAAKSLK